MGPLQRPPRDPCEQAHGPGGGRWWRSLSSGWHVHLAPALSPPGQWESPSHKPWMRPRPVGGGACGLTRGVLSHEWVSPDFAAGDAGPVCSVLEAAGTPSARTSTVLMSTSTPVLLGKPWLLPVISDPGPRNRSGNTNPGRGPGLEPPLGAPASQQPAAQGPWGQSLSGTVLGGQSVLRGLVPGRARRVQDLRPPAHGLVPWGPWPGCSWEKPCPASGEGQTGHGETMGRFRECQGCTRYLRSYPVTRVVRTHLGSGHAGLSTGLWASAGLPLMRTCLPRGLQRLWKGQPKLEQIYSPL